MRILPFFFIFVSIYSIVNAQDNRRVGYYETFVDLKETIDSIVVCKAKREMITYHQGRKVKKYIISLGMEPEGKKQFEGDLRTPEGLYTINKRDTLSSYHTNLGISYPSQQDSMFAVLYGMSAGGQIKIHGFPNNHAKLQEKTFLFDLLHSFHTTQQTSSLVD